MTAMQMKRFRHLIDAYGGDIARWPEPERAGAEALLQASAEARRWRDEAAALDRSLRSALDVGPSGDQIDRVLGRLEDLPPQFGLLDGALPAPMRRPWVPAALLAATMAIGFVLGSLSGVPEPRGAGDLVELLWSGATAEFAL